jgi:hypothetical protein
VTLVYLVLSAHGNCHTHDTYYMNCVDAGFISSLFAVKGRNCLCSPAAGQLVLRYMLAKRG